MRCGRARIQMMKQLCDGLPAAEAAALAEHLGRCASCRAEQGSLSRLAERLSGAPPSPTPAASGWPPNRQRILEQQPPSTTAAWLAHTGARPAWILAAGTVALLAALFGAVRSGKPAGVWEATRLRQDGARPPVTGSVGEPGDRRPAPPAPVVRADHGLRLPLRAAGPRAGAADPARPAGPGSLPPHPLIVHTDDHPGAFETGPDTPEDDAVYLDGRDAALGSWMLTGNTGDQDAMAWLRRRLPPMRDDFVQLRLPLLASADPGTPGLRDALKQAEAETRVVDARLFRKVTLKLKGASLEELCAELEAQTKVSMRASRGVADEKVTVFVKDRPAREVLRGVARLFGYLWERQGEEGKYRYTLLQSLREQLAEQEMRERDLNASLVALDEAMRLYAPYAGRSVEELKAQLQQARGAERERIAGLLRFGGWGALQVYRRLSPADFTALRAGGTIRYGYTPWHENRLPEELKEPFLRSFDTEGIAGGERYRQPGVTPFVELQIDRSELGELTLRAVNGVNFPDQGGIGHHQDLATSRSPSTLRPDNAGSNKALETLPAFTREVTLSPKPSCPHFAENNAPDGKAPQGKGPAAGAPGARVPGSDPLADQPHVTTADVWEEVHRVSGLPIVADYYTALHPVAAVSVAGKPLFESLCRIGDAARVRWRKDGELLLARSTSYFWDKLKEVPNRHLQRWQETRRREGALPLEQVLEIVSLSDEQLDSKSVGRAVTHCWDVPEWGIAGAGGPIRQVQNPPGLRRAYRLLAQLSPAQLRQAQGAEGLAVASLNQLQQQEAARLQLALLGTMLRVSYVPDGRYLWMPRFPINSEFRDFRVYTKLRPVSGETQEAALAEARRVHPGARAEDVVRQHGTLAVWFTDAEGQVVYDGGKPSVIFVDR